MLVFRKRYFILTVALLLLEGLIAGFVHDRVVRPYLGDLLAVVLAYCFFRSFINLPVWPLALAALAVAYLLEALQYVGLLGYLGWQHSPLARAVLGSAFSWLDMLLYTAGLAVVLALERRPRGRPRK